jgi:hypothetical protein
MGLQISMEIFTKNLFDIFYNICLNMIEKRLVDPQTRMQDTATIQHEEDGAVGCVFPSSEGLLQKSEQPEL